MFNDYLPMVGDKNEHVLIEASNHVNVLNDYYNSDDDNGDFNGDSIDFTRVNEDIDDTTKSSPDVALTIFSKQSDMIWRLNGTKMYYFLKRCLEPMGDKRKLFYI